MFHPLTENGSHLHFIKPDLYDCVLNIFIYLIVKDYCKILSGFNHRFEIVHVFPPFLRRFSKLFTVYTQFFFTLASMAGTLVVCAQSFP